MKKNGCIKSYKCLLAPLYQKKCKYFVLNHDFNDCEYYCPSESDCTNKAAQREAMRPKARWTRKPAKKEGFYWLKKDDLKIVGQALGNDMQEWSLTTHDGIHTWDSLLWDGFKRSVKPIEED